MYFVNNIGYLGKSVLGKIDFLVRNIALSEMQHIFLFIIDLMKLMSSQVIYHVLNIPKYPCFVIFHVAYLWQQHTQEGEDVGKIVC